MVDFTYSVGCGCRVTFFAASEYHTSRMLPGEACKEHTAKTQLEALDNLLVSANAALSEYRHETETVKTYLQRRRFGNDGTLYLLIVDGEGVGGFSPVRSALRIARERLGRVTLHVWDCDEMNWLQTRRTNGSLPGAVATINRRGKPLRAL